MTNWDPTRTPSEQEAAFAATVKRLREEQGWSQSDLAERCRERGLDYMTQSTISRIENGARPVRLMESQILSAVFGQTVWMMTNPETLMEAVNLGRIARGAYISAVDQVNSASAALSMALVDVTATIARMETYGEVAARDPETLRLYENLLADLRSIASGDDLEKWGLTPKDAELELGLKVRKRRRR